MHVAVIIPFRGDRDLLLWTLDGYARQILAPGHSLEVQVGHDGGAAPGGGAIVTMDGLAGLPPGHAKLTMRLYPRLGAASIRNALVQEVSKETQLLIFGNSDARPEPDMVQRHIDAMSNLPAGHMVLGAAPWETPSQPTVWDAVLSETPAVFFYSQLESGKFYDFRHTWTLNLSVRLADFQACGGFHAEIRPVYYEDLALGYRLLGKDRAGILYEDRARVLHRHPTTLQQYLDREELLGIMAPVLARHCGNAFGVLHGTRDVEALTRAFRQWVTMDLPMHKWIFQRMAEWATIPAESLGTGSQRQRSLFTIYQMHIPLKRLAFRLGFLKGMKLAEDSHWQDRKPESLWRTALQ